MTVLVVPGAFTVSSAFDGVARALAARLPAPAGPVRVLDLPARSSRLPQLHRGGLRAADRLLDDEITSASRAGGPVVLVGHSLGGLLSLRAARRHGAGTQHPVDAVALLMPAPPTGLLVDVARGTLRDPGSAARFATLVLSTAHVRRFPVRAPRGLFTDGATAEALERSRGWRVDEAWLVLTQLLLGSRTPVTPLATPTLVVAGVEDTLISLPTVRRLACHLQADLRDAGGAQLQRGAGRRRGHRRARAVAARPPHPPRGLRPPRCRPSAACSPRAGGRRAGRSRARLP